VRQNENTFGNFICWQVAKQNFACNIGRISADRRKIKVSILGKKQADRCNAVQVVRNIEKPKVIAQLLEEGNFYQLTTDNGQWVLYYDQKLPFSLSFFGNVSLLHRHGDYLNYHFQCENERNTGSGISQLIYYIIHHDYEYLKSDNRFINGRIISTVELIPDLPFRNIIDNIEEYIIDLTEGGNPEEEERRLKKYLLLTQTYKEIIPVQFYNYIRNKLTQTLDWMSDG